MLQSCVKLLEPKLQIALEQGHSHGLGLRHTGIRQLSSLEEQLMQQVIIATEEDQIVETKAHRLRSS